MSRAELLERYRELPLPTTQDEHWRFTDLAGFDPEAWTTDGGPTGCRAAVSKRRPVGYRLQATASPSPKPEP